jgi:hypothetical protein
LLAVSTACGESLTITGKDLVLCGQEVPYQLVSGSADGSYHWHLEHEAAKGPGAIWNGNAGRGSLILAFVDGPGTYHLWIQSERNGESNHLEITALAAVPLPALRDDLPQASLETALPMAPVMAAFELMAVAQTVSPSFPRSAGSAGVPPRPGSRPSIPGVLRPDAHGVIDLIAAEPAPEVEPIPNPFRVRPPSNPVPRVVPVLVSAVLAGADPGQGCGVVNGLLVSVGDAVEGFTVAAVTPEAIELQRDDAKLEVPVQSQPVFLRLPR